MAGANSYQATAAFQAYCADRGHDLTGFSSTLQEQALVRASEYADKRFRKRWRGYRKSSTQGLDWPRLDAYDDDDFALLGVPAQLSKAISEFALRALRLKPLAPDPKLPYTDRDTTGQGSVQNSGGGPGRSKFRSVKIASLEKTEAFDTSLSGTLTQDGLPAFPEAEMFLKGLLRSRTSRELGRS